MKINCGIIGLPNVGKSTLFNLLTNKYVKIANFPFSTIIPNDAEVEIPDKRLYQINYITQSQSIISDTIKFIDFAGLIKGAHKGEGLGNKILHHIKTADILCHVVRCFEDSLITHVENYINPKRDIKLINEEFILFDITQCEKEINSIKKRCINDIKTDQMLYTLQKILDILYDGIMLHSIYPFGITGLSVKKFNFLTLKPVIYIANIDKNHMNNIHYINLEMLGLYKTDVIIPYCVMHDNQSILSMKNYFDDKNILNMIIYHLLHLLQVNTFFTVNYKMVKSWIVPKGTTIIDAANRVHSDFKIGFIRAQVIKFNDFLESKGELKAKKLGKIIFVGKKYLIQDGDVLKFLFSNRKSKPLLGRIS